MPLQGRHVSSGVELGKPTHFTVNAKAAGKGKLDVQFSGLAKGDAVRDVDIVDHHDNTYTVKYTPVQQVVTLAPPTAVCLHCFHRARRPPRAVGHFRGLPTHSCFPSGRQWAWNAGDGAGKPVSL